MPAGKTFIRIKEKKKDDYIRWKTGKTSQWVSALAVKIEGLSLVLSPIWEKEKNLLLQVVL